MPSHHLIIREHLLDRGASRQLLPPPAPGTPGCTQGPVVSRLRQNDPSRILNALDAISCLADMEPPDYRFYRLTGDQSAQYFVRLTGNCELPSDGPEIMKGRSMGEHDVRHGLQHARPAGARQTS